MSYSEKNTFGHETKTVEFKSSFLVPAKDCIDEQPFVVFKAVCAMLNSDGGEIFIGVRDCGELAKGSYYGISGDIKRLNKKYVKNADTYARHIRNQIDCFFHDASYVRGIVDVAEDNEHDDVIRIRVGKANRMVFMHHRGNDHEKIAFRREGAASNEMTIAMIKQREAELRKEKAQINAVLKNDDIRSRIQEAIDRKCKLQIFGYSSSHSDTKTDRIVEPIKFLLDGRSIWAYEEKNEGSDPLRQFRLNRIDNVKVLDDEPSTHEKCYKEEYIDAFEWSRATKPTIHVTILIGPSAKNQLVEDCPEAKKYLTACGDEQWILDADVHSLDPVKRFCELFLDSINVFVPEELKMELGLIPNTEDEEKAEPTSLFRASLNILKKAFSEIKQLRKSSKR